MRFPWIEIYSTVVIAVLLFFAYVSFAISIH